MKKVEDWQQEISDLLKYAGKSQQWLADQLGFLRQHVWTKLNVAKKFDDKFYYDSLEVIRKEIESQGKKFPSYYEETPNESEIEMKGLIKTVEYLTKRLVQIEEENEKLSKENQVLRVQFSQIEDAGKRLRQGKP